MGKTTPRQSAFLNLVLAVFVAIWLFLGWKTAIVFILVEIIVAQILKLIRGRGLF